MLGSGMAFLDCTVIPVALPAVVDDLGGGLSTQQWVVDGYLLSLSALLLLGGALGDPLGRRRVFTIGLAGFAIASLACGVAPSGAALVAARLAQGVAGALLVPGSLALINSSLRHEDRARAVGMWAGLAGIGTALGPFLGGWLVDAVSWRLVFLINLPLAAIGLWATLRQVPEWRDKGVGGRLDLAGAVAFTAGLAGATYALIQVPSEGWNALTGLGAGAGAFGLVAFPLLEGLAATPLLPLRLFRSAQFSGANACTFLVEGAVGAAFFLVALQLQQTLGYTALAAGLAMLPITVVMVALSPRMGAAAQRIGPRLPMTVGPFVCAAGLALLARVEPGVGYWAVVFPAVLTFAFGLATTVAPLTATVLAAAEERYLGAASGVNNTVAWAAGLLAVAVLPPAAGIEAPGGGSLGAGFGTAMLIAAIACALGGLVSFASAPRHRRPAAKTASRPADLPGSLHGRLATWRARWRRQGSGCCLVATVAALTKAALSCAAAAP